MAILKNEVQRQEYITDLILKQDILDFPSCDCHFFPFDELLLHVMSVFQRDASVLADCAVTPQIPVL